MLLQTEVLEDVVSVREALPGDANFLFATWLRDLRHNDASPLPDDVWFPAYREFINRILSDPKVSVLVVHPKDASNEILGYLVAEPHEVLWWLYVKPKFRKRGLARLLLERAHSLNSVAAWSTPESKLRLRNRRRSRQLRSRYRPPS
jgi:GNAT superfamily N-acetyltransferase